MMSYTDTLLRMQQYNLFKIHVHNEEEKECDCLHKAILYLRRKQDTMSNYFEHRLHQIGILLHAFEEEEAFTDEYQKLLDERTDILRQLDITE